MISPMSQPATGPSGSVRAIFRLAPAEFVVFGLLLLTILGGLIRVWLSWSGPVPGPASRGWRSLCHLAGLVAASLALAAFCGAAIYSRFIGGFVNDPQLFVLWVRWGLWLSVAATLAAGLGRGRRRGVLIACSVALILIWAGMAMAP